MPKINRLELLKLQIPVPPLVTQARIEEILSAFDSVLGNLHTVTSAKRRFKRGLMQELLTGKRRFKEFEAAPWQSRRLRHITQESLRRNEDGLTLEQVMAVRKDAGIVPMKDGVASKDLTRYKVVEPGWFAYNPMRLNIGSIARSEASRTVLVSPDYVVFHCLEEELRSGYLRHFVQTPAWTRHLGRAGLGGVRVRIWYDELAKMPIQVPSVREQDAVAAVLEALDAEIGLLVRLRDALDRQRRAVGELLLTGKVRIPA